MKISQLMQDALFDCERGYYRKKNPIGKSADFITAPEISQVFGELLAAYFLHVFALKKTPTAQEKSAPKKIAFVEMGAGKGTLFGDILQTIQKLADKKNSSEGLLALEFIESATFHIVEIGEVLRDIQQKNLAPFADKFKINWHENFDDFLGFKNENRQIFFLSNELFDCFAIDQFVLTEIGWRERIVAEKKFSLAPFNKKIHDFVEQEIASDNAGLAPILKPLGAVFEFSLAAKNFMNQLCESLKKHGGIAINFDYGYEKNEFANSLQALKNHQKVDVLQSVGECDITALVNFGLLQKIVKNCGLNSSLISQKEFLIGLEIEQRCKILIEKNPEKKSEINCAIDRLINSNQMGELFKCLIVWQ